MKKFKTTLLFSFLFCFSAAVIYGGFGLGLPSIVEDKVKNDMDEKVEQKQEVFKISITNPSDGERVNGTVDIQAVVEANIEVSNVVFCINGSTKATFSSPPYGVSWNTAVKSTGSYEIEAKAFSNESSPVKDKIEVNIEPVIVSFVSPSDGQEVYGTYDIEADPQANAGIAQVLFYIDGAQVASQGSSPYIYSWNTASESSGTYTLKIVAVDTDSRSASEELTVTIKPVSLSITNPSEGDEVSGIVDITVDVESNAGIDKVKYYIGDSTVTKTESPYNYSWDTTSESNGSHTIKAKAYDTDDRTASDQVAVVVPELPYVLINEGETDEYKLYLHPVDNSTSTIWGGYGTMTDATSNTDGAANTAKIVDTLGSGTYAAKTCDDLSAYGYSDWYLPAFDQLYAIYVAWAQDDPREVYGGDLPQLYNTGHPDYESFALDYYWSSTELAPSEAIYIDFNNGGGINGSKKDSNYVRAVRSSQ